MHRDLLQPDRDRRIELTRRNGLRVDVLDGDGDRRIAVKGRPSGQHLIHHNTERIKIRPCIHMRALGLLRRNVVYRAERLARKRALSRRHLRNAEVCDLDAAILEHHDVVRLDVTVDNAAAVRVLERLCDLRGKMQRLAPVEHLLLLHILLERDAVDQLHNDIVHILGMGHVIDAHDVWMGHHGDGLRLGMEAAAELLVLRKLLLEYLDGDEAVQAVAARLVYDGHAAGADHLQYFVAIIQ